MYREHIERQFAHNVLVFVFFQLFSIFGFKVELEEIVSNDGIVVVVVLVVFDLNFNLMVASGKSGETFV